MTINRYSAASAIDLLERARVDAGLAPSSQTVVEARVRAGLSPTQDVSSTVSACRSVEAQLRRAGEGLSGLLARLGRTGTRTDADRLIGQAITGFLADLSSAVAEGPADSSIDALLVWIGETQDTLSEAQVAFEEAIKMRPANGRRSFPAAPSPSSDMHAHTAKALEHAERGIETARQLEQTVRQSFPRAGWRR